MPGNRSNPREKKATNGTPREVCRLRLFVARPTPSSCRAEANLAAALAAFGPDLAFEVETVDVLKSAHQAAKDGIIVTPCLLQVGAVPPLTLVGDLCDAESLRLFLEKARSRLSAMGGATSERA
jgi:hypothetical protein